MLFFIATAPLYILTSHVPFTLYHLADLHAESLGLSVASFTLLHKAQGTSLIPSIIT